jgi:hypothetical protein
MRKADDGTVGIMITRTPVPTLAHVVWAQLHHPKGNTGTYKHVTMVIGSDHRIDVLHGIVDGAGIQHDASGEEN